MTQPEARIGKKIREFLESEGAYVFKIHGSPTMRAGLPDLIVCFDGNFWGIEVKQPGKKPTAIQLHEHEKIKKAGGAVIVATCVDDVRVIVA